VQGIGGKTNLSMRFIDIISALEVETQMLEEPL
jgi:hypothetical protein